MAHQMRSLQHEVDILRKSPLLKTNGNGQTHKAHA